MLPNTISIDGPAGSGKSTLGLKLAKKLNYLYFDTGIMYRAVAYVAISHSVAMDEHKAVADLASNVQIDVRAPSIDDDRVNDVLVDGEDVTWAIRKPEIDSCVSVVAANPGVREALTSQQRRIGLRGEVVMVGRDIGTVVLPEADLKIFLDASVEERARRRYRECLERGEDVSYEEILESIRRRDKIDSTREVAPLKPADDAVIINSDELDAKQVLERILALL